MNHSHFKSASEPLIDPPSSPSSDQTHTRTGSPTQTTAGGGFVNYLSNLKDRALKSNNHNEKSTSPNTPPRPTITIINTDANVLIVSPRTIRRKTWPTSSRGNSYQKRKGVLLSGDEERDSVINIYWEHRDHLEQDLRARTDLDTQTPHEDLYVPKQGQMEEQSQSLPNTPFLITEFPTSPSSSSSSIPTPSSSSSFMSITSSSPLLSKLTRNLSYFFVNDAHKMLPHAYFATENNSKSSFIMDPTETKLSVARTSVW
ncbi:12549_t:CDS:2 [Ambispora gerdemannii]|uniref:12549_t:CDS:1 n=1 Tax=Ambispora gerdemannii TaxID=144530 RepID=A0A9N8VLQ8_9GLOM|nr:12549_t:CDS:2 [Ambispora gerdemannii]